MSATVERDPERAAYNSGARLRATTAVVFAAADGLRARLDALGLSLAPLPDAPRGCHPLCVDLWQVEAGRLESAGIDQHAWSSGASAAVAAATLGAAGAPFGAGLLGLEGALAGARAGAGGGPLSALWGAAFGWASGSALGAARTTAWAAAFGASMGERLSHATSHALGSYDEVLVGVPNVQRPGSARKYMFVLGMLSNGEVSIWGDRTLGCGYNKRKAAIVAQGFERYDVRAEAGLGLRARFTPAAGAAWQALDHHTAGRDALGGYPALFAQPLLGALGDGRFAVSFVDRFYGDRQLRFAPVAGELVIADETIPGLPGGSHVLAPLSAVARYGAFQCDRLQVKVTYPRAC